MPAVIVASCGATGFTAAQEGKMRRDYRGKGRRTAEAKRNS